MIEVGLPYEASHKMRDLIDDNYQLLMVISRFGIPLGFGNRTIAEICRDRNVDCDTFLAVANYISGKPFDRNPIDLKSMMKYLQSAHRYFLDFNLPDIRRKLIDAIDCSGADSAAMLILKFFDEYVREVRRHMEYENSTVFDYVAQLIEGHPCGQFTISVFAAHHHSIASKLMELKDILIRHYPEKDDSDKLNAVLFDIISCEQDLVSHCAVEDQLFVPAVAIAEENLRQLSGDCCDDSEIQPQDDKQDDGKLDSLSQREKEIIVCIAKGLSNKEIADKLCISVHTVATHRRNINEKLDIHSSAGLAIFAVINQLVSLDEVK